MTFINIVELLQLLKVKLVDICRSISDRFTLPSVDTSDAHRIFGAESLEVI